MIHTDGRPRRPVPEMQGLLQNYLYSPTKS